MTETNHSDPFQDDNILSLFPRTFRNSKHAVKSNDLDSIHKFMTSLSLQNPNKHLEEARAVFDSGPEFLNTKDSEADKKENENLRGNRPALPRKRAKFSLKPDTRQPCTFEVPIFQPHLYKDPVEYFAQYEKDENSKKEMKRLGVYKEVDAPKESTKVKKLRPGIERKRPTYKHLYPSESQDENSQDNVGFSSETQMDTSCAPETLLDNVEFSSQSQSDKAFTQETLQDQIGSLPARYSQRQSFTPNYQSKENESTASKYMSEDQSEKLFKDLMSGKLDAKKTLSSLLGTKPRVREKLHLPDISDYPRIDLLSDRNRITNMASTTASKSPLSSISTFGKRLSMSVKAIDPFSSQDMDSFPSTAPEIIRSVHSSKVTETPVHEVLQKVSAETLIHIIEPDDLPEPIISMEDHEQCPDMEARDNDADEAGSYTVINEQTNHSVPGNAEDTYTESNLYVEDITDNVHSHCSQDMDENVEYMTEKAGSFTSPEVIEVSTTEKLKSPSFQSAQKDANAMEDLDASRPAQNTDIISEQNEEHPKISANNRKKTTKARQTDLKKRQSLADAGSSWAAGVRRSKRIKRKPLETWKGERFVYGRIHNSLPTVIGIKYLSPGKSSFKVESFVSNKYKDLVELSALH